MVACSYLLFIKIHSFMISGWSRWLPDVQRHVLFCTVHMMLKHGLSTFCFLPLKLSPVQDAWYVQYTCVLLRKKEYRRAHIGSTGAKVTTTIRPNLLRRCKPAVDLDHLGFEVRRDARVQRSKQALLQPCRTDCCPGTWSKCRGCPSPTTT